MNALYTMDAVSMLPAAGGVALLLSDPLAVLAVVGGLATVVLNFWLFRMAGRHSSAPAAEEDRSAPPRGRAALFLAPLALQEEGLTFGEVIRDIPADPASLFVYTLLAASITLVWAANRPKRGR